jgi:divalent metal cation (Fe/Co/Zn/Cd) transporter
VWRFRREQRDPVAAEHLERRAQSCVALAMLAVAVYVDVQAVRGLTGRSHPEASALGVTLAAASLVVLPWLGGLKLRVASHLGSGALRGDGVLTLASAALAGVALAALLVNATLGWWWADPSAALLIATALAVEAMRVATRHRFG